MDLDNQKLYLGFVVVIHLLYTRISNLHAFIIRCMITGKYGLEYTCWHFSLSVHECVGP